MIDVRGIDNVLFAVGNLGEAERFYGGLLGLVAAFAFREAGIVGYRLGEEEPGLMIREQPHLAPGPARETPRLWPEVPDARASADALADAGVRPLDRPQRCAPGGLWRSRTLGATSSASPTTATIPPALAAAGKPVRR